MRNKWGVARHSSYIQLENRETKEALTQAGCKTAQTYDVIIVGGGGAGAACALEASLNGARVLLLQGERGGAGAAGANAGFLLCGGSLFYHEAEERWGGRRAKLIWDQTAHELARQKRHFPEVIKETGSWRCVGRQDDTSEDETRDIQRQYRAMTDAGLDVKLAERDGSESLFVPADAWCDPVARIAAGWRQVRQAGGVILPTGTVTWRRDRSDWVVSDTHNEWRSPNLVVSSDAHLESQIPKLRGTVATHRLQMLRASKPGVNTDTPTYMRWGYDYAINHQNKLHLGGGRDYSEQREAYGQWDGECDVTRETQSYLEGLAEFLCREPVEIERRWAAPVGYTQNGLPVVGEIEGGLWAVGGYNGHGNLLSWLLGREIALEITREERGVLAGDFGI